MTDSANPFETAPRAHWRGMGEVEHFVQFYETDNCLMESLEGFISEGLRLGDACLVVATNPHRRSLHENLRASGHEIDVALSTGQFVSLDADEALARFIVDGMPEPRRFADAIGKVVANAGANRSRLRIFGEMVACLWAEGNLAGAIRLEELWNDLRVQHPFALYCAYPMDKLGGESKYDALQNLCSAHTHVIPAESYNAIPSSDERLRAILLLQQKARTLRAEIEERECAEETIRLLLRISEKLNSTLNPDELLDSLVIEAVKLVRAEGGFAGLRTPEGMVCRRYLLRGAWNSFEEIYPPMCGLPGWLLVNKAPYLSNDASADGQFSGGRTFKHRVRQALSVPVLDADGEILAFFELHNRREGEGFTQTDQERLIAVAQVASIAIQNALAYRRIKRSEQERAELLKSEQDARVKAEEASRLKDEFLATVSHELRTPLTAIMGWAHMLKNGKLDDETIARALETIERNAFSQAQLVEDILDTSRIITGKLRLKVEPVDLVAVINAAIDSVQLAVDSKGIYLEVTLDTSARRVVGDACRLQQVVWNLLSNAIKFTPSGGNIRIHLKRFGSETQISVTDTGCGIDSDFLPFVFDRFRQADGSTTRKHGGLGIGLAIVRHLVELHGGEASVESLGEGRGSAFHIKLPLHSARLNAKNGEGKDEEISSDAGEGVRPHLSLTGERMLIVDDDKDVLIFLSAVLSEKGAEVRTALSVQEALKAIQDFKPNMLVSDIAMPGEDGYSLIRKVRSSEIGNEKRLHAVALTAYAGAEDRERALSEGFDTFVSKPVNPVKFIKTISSLIQSEA